MRFDEMQCDVEDLYPSSGPGCFSFDKDPLALLATLANTSHTCRCLPAVEVPPWTLNLTSKGQWLCKATRRYKQNLTFKEIPQQSARSMDAQDYVDVLNRVDVFSTALRKRCNAELMCFLRRSWL